MSTYTYPPEETQREIKKMKLVLWSVVVSILLIFGVGNLLVILMNTVESKGEFILFSILFIAFLFVVAYFTINSIIKRWRPIRIVLLNDRIIEERTGYRKYYIMRSEIEIIIDIPNEGISVHSLNSSRRIFVKSNLVDYNHFKSELSSWYTVSGESSHNYFRRENIRTIRAPLIILTFIFLGVTPFNKDWEPVRIMILLFIYSLGIVFPLVTGRIDSTLTRKDEPFIYWFIMTSLCAIPGVSFFFADYEKVSANLTNLYESRPEIFLILILIVIIWVFLVFQIVKKHREKQRIQLSQGKIK